MKKILALVLALVLACSVMLVPASAASGINANEQAIYDLLFTPITVGGVTVSFLDGRQGEVTNFFNQDGIDMTDAQRDEIAAYINACIAFKDDPEVIAWAQSGDVSMKSLPQRVRSTFLNNATEACAVMGLIFVYHAANNGVTITNANGDVLVSTNAVVKKTGNETNTVAIALAAAAVFVLAAAAYVTTKKTAKVAA